MKHVHRLLVTSATYRLLSAERRAGSAEQDVGTPRSEFRDSRSVDPDNRLLWRANTRRVEAELVRDGLLYLGGSLELTLGGPDIDQQLGETSRRRSLYFRHAYEKQMKFLMLFDAANVNECYQRSESVIPQQALAVANSTLSFTQSRLLARELSGCVPRDDQASFVKAAFERILTRPPTAEEQQACEQFVQQQATRLDDPAALTAIVGGGKAEVAPATDPAQRARENLVHVLMNHNDFVTIR